MNTPASTPVVPPVVNPPAAPAAAPAPEPLPQKFMERFSKGTDSTNGIKPDPTPATATPLAAPAAPAAPAAAAPPAPPAPAAPAAPAKKERKVAKGYQQPPPAPGITKDDVREIVKGAVEASVEANKPQPLPEPELLDEEKEQIEVFTQMEKMHPEKYKGLVTKAKVAIAAFSKFEEDWKKTHPGEEFDPASKEAEEFRDKNSPDYNQSDYRKAEIQREIEPVRTENETLKKELAKVTAETTDAKLAPIITATVVESASAVAKEIDPKLIEVVRADGTIDGAKAAAFIEDNPEVGRILIGGVEQAAQWSKAVTLMAAGREDKINARVVEVVNPFTGKKENRNEMVHNIDLFCLDLESRIKNLDPAKQLDGDGRKFATQKEMASLSAAERKQHWTLTPDFIIYRANKDIIRGATGEAKSEQDRLDKIAAKRGLANPAAAPAAPAAEVPPEPVKPTKRPETVEAPPGGTGDQPTPGAADQSVFSKRFRAGTGLITV